MTEQEILIEQHGFFGDAIFGFKTFALIVLRLFRNSILSPTTKFSSNLKLRDAPVISLSETELWSSDDTEHNWILTAGKVQNLRIAARRLHGTEVPANEVFSFWKHIGPPFRSRGYVVGREIREGCIVPAVAGGLCQLSNALYDSALKAGFEIIERHKHTKVVKGSLAEIDRDATVKWNYIDLRFRSTHSFRIEVDLTADKLVVKFRSDSRRSTSDIPHTMNLVQPSKLNDCYSCGNFECFKHPGKVVRKEQASTTTFILDDNWSEYEEYLRTIAGAHDRVIRPVFVDKIARSLMIRISSRLKRNVFSQILKLDRMVAAKMIKRIPLESTHLVVSQNLLPFIFEYGALGGRTYDVLMTRLPIERLHERLDFAHKKYPESATLNDFRADARLVDFENAALTQARHIITPHAEIAGIFKHKVVRLSWKTPSATPNQTTRGGSVLFPASALARKGAYEMRQLARELSLTVKILGAATEDESFWNGFETEKAGAEPFENVSLIVYPTYIEHQPRILLKAVAAGIPIVTTDATGLTPRENVTVVPVGDYDALKQAVIGRLTDLNLIRQAKIA